MEKFILYLDGKTSNLISRISVPPFQKQPFLDVLQYLSKLLLRRPFRDFVYFNPP